MKSYFTAVPTAGERDDDIMKPDIWKLMMEMDLSAAGTQLVLHCAPLLAGLKTSNLLMIQKEQEEEVKRLLERMRISSFTLFCGPSRAALLLYRFRQLNQYLTEPAVLELLMGTGYRKFMLPELLAEFSHRYRAYMEQNRNFPHEMGIFLGYPVEDVRGFIKNRGKNFLLTGYWKVYENLTEKAALFRKFDLAKEALLFQMADGVTVPEAVAGMAGNGRIC